MGNLGPEEQRSCAIVVEMPGSRGVTVNGRWRTYTGDCRRPGKVLVVLSTAALIAGLMQATTPSSMAAGTCGLSSGTSDKVYVDKDSSELGNSKFDHVRGDAEVGTINPCVGTQAFPYSAGSWMMLANLEHSCCAEIIQIGYGQGCTNCIVDFIYTPGGQGAGAAWPGTLTPQSGHRVRLVIERVFSNPHLSTRYTVKDIDTGATQTTSRSGFYSGFDKAWWGAEAIDTSAEVGQDAAIDSNVAYMGYSTFSTGTISYRSGMVFDTCYCETDPGDPSDIEKQGGTNSAEHGHLGTWVYGNDMVNFESH